MPFVVLLQKATFIFLFVTLRFFVQLKLKGEENLSSLKRPFIVVANHKGYFDHWLICFSLIKVMGFKVLPFYFFSADFLFQQWWTGWGLFLRAYGAFPAHKGKGLSVSLKEPQEILKKGGVVVFYPEGHIVKDPHIIGEPRRGIGALALWSGARILPVAIKRGGEPKKSVKIIFGQPFYVKDILKPGSLVGDESDYPLVARLVMDRVKDLFYGVE